MTLTVDAPEARDISTAPTVTHSSAGTTTSRAATLGWRFGSDAEFVNSAELSTVEATVLGMSALGADVSAMQRALLLPEETVGDFLRSAYHAVGASDRTQALAWAVREGLLTPVVDDGSVALPTRPGAPDGQAA